MKGHHKSQTGPKNRMIKKMLTVLPVLFLVALIVAVTGLGRTIKAEKARICNDVIAGLEQRFPGITGQVEMCDAATPLTWERYTGNWRGAYEGWQLSKESFTSTMKKTLPGLDNFYMAGQWVNPGGGMPTAAVSGRHTLQMICKKDKKKFVTSKI